METKNKNKKTVIMLAVIGIAIVCICVIGVLTKKAYDRHQEELRLQAIETKNSEIDAEYQKFENEEDRDKKLKVLKQEAESAEKYKKTEGAYEECSSHYEKIVAQMKNSFVSEYDDTIKTIVDKIGDDVEKVDDKETLKNAVSEFTAFKDTLKDEFEKYNTVEQDSFDEYNSTIDEYVKKYNDRVTAIEKAEEEARKKAEEEAKKKAEESAKKDTKDAVVEEAAKAAQEEAERKAAEEAAAAEAGQNSESAYSGGSGTEERDYYYDNSSNGSSSGSDSGSNSNGDDWSAGMYHSWYVDENGNKIEGSGDYFDRSTGELYDEDGNDLGNLGEWLWD